MLELFKAEGKSILKVAEESGIPDSTFRRKLKDPQTFSIRELIAIALVLHITLVDLLFDLEPAAVA